MTALNAGLALLGALLGGPASASEHIVLVVGGIEKQIYLPARLTESLGYFRDQDLDVEFRTEASGVSAEDEMLAGTVQGVIGFYDHTIDLQARGKAAQSVVQFSIAPGEVELVARRVADVIKSPADFAGHNLGVTGLGSSTNFLTQYLAVSHGVKLSEFNSVPVESGTSFLAALRQGTIDAGMTTEPTASRAISSGLAVLLVDLRTPEQTEKALGGLYPSACLYMSTTWIYSHRSAVQKLARAFVKTLRFISEHSAEEITARLPPEYSAADRTAYVSALALSKSMFAPDGVMPPNGPAVVLKVLSAVDKSVHGKSIDLSKTYTTEFVNTAH